MIVLDTHALVWWVNDEGQLSPRAAKAINDERKAHGRILVSAISAWEIAMLVVKGRLVLAMDVEDWLDACRSVDEVDLVPLSPRVLVQSTRLPGRFHADPADRMIVAFARECNAALVTADRRIQRYQHVRCVW